jgi:anti-sigma factor RsiW
MEDHGHGGFEDRLSEYLDGELSAAERGEMETHVRACIACRATLEQLRAVKERAAALQHRPPGPEVWDRIAGRIGAPGLRLEDTTDELATRRKGKRVRLPWLRVGAAAAAVLAIGIGIGRMTTVSPRRLPPQTVTAPAPGTPMTSDAYRVAVAQHLDRTEALLTSFRAEAASGQVDPQVRQWADQTLTSTRLLLDSPAADDPKVRTLLEDLELVLAQIAALPAKNEPNEVDLARRAVDESRVLPRMRTMAPGPAPVTHGET